MLNDLVVDTNVWVDAGNPGVKRFKNSVAFVKKMSEVETVVKVDPGYKWDSPTNISKIVSEYSEKLSPGGIGFEALRILAMSGRIIAVDALPPYNVKRQVIRIIKNPRDRVFLLVAIASRDQMLVSHDHKDFQISKRKTIKKDYGVTVIESDCCLALL